MLSKMDQLHLVDKILGSLPPPPNADEPSEILDEAIRRHAELESGQVSPLPEAAFWAGVRRRNAFHPTFSGTSTGPVITTPQTEVGPVG